MSLITYAITQRGANVVTGDTAEVFHNGECVFVTITEVIKLTLGQGTVYRATIDGTDQTIDYNGKRDLFDAIANV